MKTIKIAILTICRHLIQCHETQWQCCVMGTAPSNCGCTLCCYGLGYPRVATLPPLEPLVTDAALSVAMDLALQGPCASEAVWHLP